MSLESLIEDSGQECSVLAPPSGSTTQTALGGASTGTANWPAVAAGIPCLVRTTGSSLNLGANDTQGNRVYGKIFLASDPVPGGMNVRHRIRVTQAGRGSLTLLGTYNVLSVIDPNGMGRMVSVGVEKLASA